MKISQLITALQAIQAMDGDIEVAYEYDGPDARTRIDVTEVESEISRMGCTLVAVIR